jgi:hypothetical protein
MKALRESNPRRPDATAAAKRSRSPIKPALGKCSTIRHSRGAHNASARISSGTLIRSRACTLTSRQKANAPGTSGDPACAKLNAASGSHAIAAASNAS